MKTLLPALRIFRRFAVPAIAAASLPALLAVLLPSDSSSAASQFTNNVGGGAAGIAVETFRPKVIFVNQGDSVRFVNPYEEIHTVTFLTDNKVPDLIQLAAPPGPTTPPKLIFNPRVSTPAPSQ